MKNNDRKLIREKDLLILLHFNKLGYQSLYSSLFLVDIDEYFHKAGG